MKNLYYFLCICMMSLIMRTAHAQCNYNFTFTNAGGTLYMDNTPTVNLPAQIQWTVNGDFASSSDDASFSPQGGPGIYTVCMTVNDQGCTPVTTYLCDTVHIGPDTCIVDIQYTFHGDTVFFQNTPDVLFPAGSTFWSVGAQSLNNINDPYFILPGPGDYPWSGVISKPGCPNIYQFDTLRYDTACNYQFTYTESLGVLYLDNSAEVSAPASISWNINGNPFSNTNDPFYVSPGPGTYQVCMIVVNMACQVQTTYQCDTVTIAPPGCNYSFNYTVSGDTIHLDNSPAVNSPSTLYWTENNNLISTSNDPYWISPGPGSYYICMVISDQACPGGQFLACDTIVIPGNPCNYTFNYQQSGNIVTLNNVPNVTSPATISWTVNGNQISTQNDPVWTAPGPGTYAICMVVVDMSCPVQTTYQCDTLVISGNPCQYTLVENNSLSMYNYTTNPPVQAPATIIWYLDAAPLGTSPSQSGSLTSLSPGLHTICAVISDPNCPSTVTLCDTVGSLCNYSFTHQQSGNIVTLNNVPNVSAPTTITWTVNGNQISTQNDPVWTAPGPGTYAICMIVVDMACQPNPTFYQCDTIIIPPNNCTYNFTYSVSEDSVFLNNTPQVNAPATISWTVNGNPVSSSNDPVWISPTPGYYMICMTVVDMSCPNPTTQICDTVLVLPGNCQYQYTYTIQGDSIHFDNSPQVSAPATIQWTVNGNLLSTTNDPMFYMTLPDTYVVCMLVVDMSCTLMPTTYLCDTIIKYPVSADVLLNTPGGISVYPNPAEHSVWVQLSDMEESINQLQIRDIQGRLVLKRMFDRTQNSENILLNELNSGVYILEVISGEKQFTQRLMIR